MPKFTIIVPVYNVAKYLRKSLESIRKQTFKDFEVICIDDCSTDNSLSILKGYASRDNRFKVITLSENKGVAFARNRALDEAVGDYIAFVDPDDWIEISLLKKVSDVIDIASNCDLIWFNHYLYDEKTKKSEKNDKKIREDLVDYIGILPQTINLTVGTIWDKIYKRQAIEDINLRFSEGYLVEDDEFTFKFIVNYPYLYRLNCSLYYYRKNRENSYCTSYKYKIAEDGLKIFYKIYNYCKEIGKFEEYKFALLELLASRIVDLKSQHNLILYKQALEMIEAIEYPTLYELK